MAVAMAENKMLHPVLRVLQLIFAIIVIGTDGYAIHVYRGHTTYIHDPFGDFYAYEGVPNAWGFLIFCAVWTIIAAIFQLVTESAFTDRVVIGYIRVAVELVALLSWFAGWIAVAVNIGGGACSEGFTSCGALEAATVFGAIEWLLFMVTGTLAISLFLNSRSRSKTSMTRPTADI